MPRAKKYKLLKVRLKSMRIFFFSLKASSGLYKPFLGAFTFWVQNSVFLLFEHLSHGLRSQLFFERKLVCNTANKNPIFIDRLIFLKKQNRTKPVIVVLVWKRIIVKNNLIHKKMYLISFYIFIWAFGLLKY